MLLMLLMNIATGEIKEDATHSVKEHMIKGGKT